MKEFPLPTVSDFIDIAILKVENAYMYKTHTEKWSYHPPVSEYAYLTFILSGEAYFNIDGKEFTVKKNDIVFRNSGVNFVSKGKSGSFEYLICHMVLKDDIPESILPLHFTPDDPEYIRQLFQKLIYEYEIKSFTYPLLVKSQLYKILNHLIASNSGNTQSQKHTAILRSILYMEKNIYSKDLNVETIAEQSGISTVYFRKVFREIYGISPLKYITEMRMERAAELLYYENFSVAQIADTVGYRYTVYFTKLFKEKYGVSPREYKQRNYQ